MNKGNRCKVHALMHKRNPESTQGERANLKLMYPESWNEVIPYWLSAMSSNKCKRMPVGGRDASRSIPTRVMPSIC
jgi:hypothetical protein